MPERKRLLILIRPKPSSTCFLAACEDALGRGIEAVISPVFEIVPLSSQVDLNAYETVVATSQNAIEQMGRRLQNRRVVTVGKRTAKAARGFGADAICLGADVDSFLENTVPINAPAVHIRGVHSRGNLAVKLSELGLPTDECILYDQIERPLSEAAKSALAEGTAVVPVFSPRSSRLVASHPVHPETHVIAISEAAAEAWTANGLVQIADHPDSKSMRDLVIAAL